MRTRIIFSVLLVLVVAVFYFSKPNAKEYSVTNTVSSFQNDTTFRIGAYWDGIVLTNYDSLKELGFNLWQVTSNINSGWYDAGITGDNREADSASGYISKITGKIETNMSSGNLKTIMDRAKINYLGLGKRSDYECDITSNANPNYWFYAYREHDTTVSREFQDNTQYGSNNLYVRFSSTSIGKTSGYVVKGLIANREQISYPCSQSFKWYVMPRIRIDTNVFLYSDTTTVCRIEIHNYKDSIIKNVIIKAKNFAKPDSVYHGQYIDQFYFSAGEGNLIINSTEAFNPNHEPYYKDTCGVDFRVWWTGECDMWLDRVRVENEIAYDLFSNDWNNPNFVQYQNWLRWEAQNIAGAEQGNVHYFLIDEPEFATLPVLSYLNKKIETLSNHTTSVVPVFSRNNFKAGLPRHDYVNYSIGQLKTFLIDTAGFKMFSFDCYPF
ncbi:MAG: hypothetical protein NTU73_02885, partial [Ignavibacteriae bacterium]|nr:hypothetical protein [Ignavibacteriota bacterium]